jgi:hypothetical protein
MSGSRVVGVLLLLGVFAWAGCTSKDWPAYRYKAERTAQQPNTSALSDPSRVPSLHQLGSSDSIGFRGW